MHKTNFFGPFPSVPEELKEIPSYVKWEEQDIPKNEATSLTLIKFAEESWFALAKKGNEITLSCNLHYGNAKKDDNEKTWFADEITNNKSVSSFSEAWEHISEQAWGLDVSMSNEDERPQAEKVQKIKMKLG